jgi:hypothetical protein
MIAQNNNYFNTTVPDTARAFFGWRQNIVVDNGEAA